jgi:hypothetical protein
MKEEKNISSRIRLWKKGDQIFYESGNGDEPKPVKLVRARPVSFRDGYVSIQDQSNKEIMFLESLEGIDPESRRVIEEELIQRYILSRIIRVIDAQAHFGMRYFHVETDRGERRFALKDASKNAVFVTDDYLILRDTLGCRYEIPSMEALDLRSRLEILKIL